MTVRARPYPSTRRSETEELVFLALEARRARSPETSVSRVDLRAEVRAKGVGDTGLIDNVLSNPPTRVRKTAKGVRGIHHFYLDTTKGNIKNATSCAEASMYAVEDLDAVEILISLKLDR